VLPPRRCSSLASNYHGGGAADKKPDFGLANAGERFPHLPKECPELPAKACAPITTLCYFSKRRLQTRLSDQHSEHTSTEPRLPPLRLSLRRIVAMNETSLSGPLQAFSSARACARPARSYLLVISRNPEAIERALHAA
jgi:hypothetical protein